jgi:hypothetical protein
MKDCDVGGTRTKRVTGMFRIEDPIGWRGMLLFLRRTLGKARTRDGRIGLLILSCWREGYRSGLKRGRREGRR